MFRDTDPALMVGVKEQEVMELQAMHRRLCGKAVLLSLQKCELTNPAKVLNNMVDHKPLPSVLRIAHADKKLSVSHRLEMYLW